jgi:hypothetical protein
MLFDLTCLVASTYDDIAVVVGGGGGGGGGGELFAIARRSDGCGDLD